LSQWIAYLADGDRSAFTPVFEALWPRVRAPCLSLLKHPEDAADAAQQAMEKILTRAADYDRSRTAPPWALAMLLGCGVPSDTGSAHRASRFRRQSAEVMRLEAVRDELTGSVPPMPSDPHADAEMEHMSELSGTDLDGMFLLDMIPHHASALPVAHRSIDHLENAELIEMAQTIQDAQAHEIGQMRAMLEELGIQSAGEDMAPANTDRPDFGLVGDRRIPLTPRDDVTFIDFFLPHHEMALMMADHAIAHGENPEVIAMATQMKATQTAEIATMRSQREALTGSGDSPTVPSDPHMEEEMLEMAQASPPEVDRMFLEGMIVHHASALPTAHRARPHVTDPELAQLANTMYLEQAREIGEMKTILEAM
jgi:uncharacterized protein (DUF305 family)